MLSNKVMLSLLLVLAGSAQAVDPIIGMSLNYKCKLDDKTILIKDVGLAARPVRPGVTMSTWGATVSKSSSAIGNIFSNLIFAYGGITRGAGGTVKIANFGNVDLDYAFQIVIESQNPKYPVNTMLFSLRSNIPAQKYSCTTF